MIRILIASFLIISQNCFSQNFWEPTHRPYGSTGEVNTVYSSNDGRIFAGIYSTGLYCSTDNGKSFSIINLPFSSYSAVPIVVDQKGNIFVSGGNILFKSTDKGLTWGNVLPLHYISLLYSDTVGNIFAATSGDGIYISTDEGTSWTKLNLNPSIAYDNAIGENYNGDLFVSGSLYLQNEYTHICIRSTDKGKTWSTLSIPQNLYIKNFAFAPKGHIVAEFASNNFNDSVGFLISNDNGSTFIQRNVGLSINNNIIFDRICNCFFTISGSNFIRSNDFGYSWSIVSNIESGIVGSTLIAENQMGEIFIGTGTGLIRTSNYGASWIRSDSSLMVTSVNHLTLFPYNKIYVGTDRNGVFKLADDKVSWQKEDSAYAGSFLISQNGNYLVSDGRIHISSNGGNNWSTIKNNYSSTSELTIASNGYIFCGGGYAYGVHAASGSYIDCSTDNGNTWSTVYVKNSGNGGGINTLTATLHDIIIASGNNEGVIMSTDLGKSWNSSINGLPSNIDCSVIRARSDGLVLLGSSSYGMFRSTDEGLSWNSINNGLSSLNVTSIAFNNADKIFAGTAGGVFESSNNGDSWLPLNSGLTDLSVTSLLCDSLGYLYAATNSSGVFRSIGVTTNVEQVQNIIPRTYSLFQNYPNPFNSSTSISYALPKASHVIIKVYDILGREIATLVNEEKNAGSYNAEFNASNLASGIYLYRMQAGNFAETRKLILMK
jgi:photosystem II stability/assembly factor-like uncharacterized protein